MIDDPGTNPDDIDITSSTTGKLLFKFSPTLKRYNQQPRPIAVVSKTIKGVLLIPANQIIYNEDEKLGAGAQGVVYKAKWNTREVVFKKLSEAKRTFLSELEVWRYVLAMLQLILILH